MGAARKLMVADLFCGAGGTSEGVAQACKELDLVVELLAINHWQTAIATHKKNHPWARHLCANVENVDPRRVVPCQRLDLLVASPECIWHSTARGGRPINDQARSTAWRVLEWCEKLYVSNVLVENVPEFGGWGPLNADGRPNKSRKGAIFEAFVANLRAMNYRVEWKVLNAADFGGATTRRRLFILARKNGKKIVWPTQTHSKDASTRDIFLNLKPWRSAREIIDWQNKGKSIFGRKKPLARSTIDRIAAGIRRFCHPSLVRPFLVMLYGTNDVRPIELPMPTVTAEGQHIGLVQPFITDVRHGDARTVDPAAPMPTLTGKNGHAIVEPYLVKYYSSGDGKEAHSVRDPLDTITTKERFALVTPDGTIGLDIYFRMLTVDELAAAMGFKNYKFTGTKTDQVRQIGNAVEVNMAKALVGELLK